MQPEMSFVKQVGSKISLGKIEAKKGRGKAINKELVSAKI